MESESRVSFEVKGKQGNGESEVVKKYGGEGKDRDWVIARRRRVEECFFPKRGERGSQVQKLTGEKTKQIKTLPKSGLREGNDAGEREMKSRKKILGIMEVKGRS